MIDPGLLIGCFIIILGCLWFLRNIMRNALIDAEWRMLDHMETIHRQTIDAHDRIYNLRKLVLSLMQKVANTNNMYISSFDHFNKCLVENKTAHELFVSRLLNLERWRERDLAVSQRNIEELAKKIHSMPERGEGGRFVKAKGD